MHLNENYVEQLCDKIVYFNPKVYISISKSRIYAKMLVDLDILKDKINPSWEL